ncbi:hypothetical protein N3930_22205, partial [Bacillus thuringiensis]|nr:hypothetical protein [Bacillus thuringiensis]
DIKDIRLEIRSLEMRTTGNEKDIINLINRLFTAYNSGIKSYLHVPFHGVNKTSSPLLIFYLNHITFGKPIYKLLI